MQIFDENPKRICYCNDAIKEGIYTKAIENESFSIYGNLIQGKNILINYNGNLTKNYTSENKIPNLYLYYCFDNDWENKKIINMSVCKQKNALSYCFIINLPTDHTNINIAFTNDNNEWDTDIKGSYYIKMYPDIEKEILKRYGLDSTPPTIISDNLPASCKSLIEKVKEKVVTIFSFFKLKRC